VGVEMDDHVRPHSRCVIYGLSASGVASRQVGDAEYGVDLNHQITASTECAAWLATYTYIRVTPDDNSS
jgi:hypothetical protein